MVTENRDDKVTLGLTPAASGNLQVLMETGWFENEIDVFRLAIALAIREGAAASPEEMSGLVTKWSVAIDSDGRIRTLVGLMAEEDSSRSYALAERYAVAGIAYLHRRLVVENASFSEIMRAEDKEEGS